jgi:hypothetical protein
MREYTTETLLIQQARACFLENVFNTFRALEARGREVTGNDRAAAAVAEFLAAAAEPPERTDGGRLPSEAALDNVVVFPDERSDWPRSA